MAIVKKMNDEGGTTDGMYHHRYSGGGTDQFEFPGGSTPHDHIGDTFVMTVQVELKAVVSDRIADGPREVLAFRVINSAPPKLVAKAGGADPNQTSIDDFGDDEDDDGAGDYGDYGDEVEVGNLYADDEDAYDPAQDNPFTIVSNGDA